MWRAQSAPPWLNFKLWIWLTDLPKSRRPRPPRFLRRLCIPKIPRSPCTCTHSVLSNGILSDKTGDFERRSGLLKVSDAKMVPSAIMSPYIFTETSIAIHSKLPILLLPPKKEHAKLVPARILPLLSYHTRQRRRRARRRRHPIFMDPKTTPTKLSRWDDLTGHILMLSSSQRELLLCLHVFQCQKHVKWLCRIES